MPGHLLCRSSLASSPLTPGAAKAATLLASARGQISTLQDRVFRLQQCDQNIVSLNDCITVMKGQGQDGLVRLPLAQDDRQLLVQWLGVIQTQLQNLILRLEISGPALETVKLNGQLVKLGIIWWLMGISVSGRHFVPEKKVFEAFGVIVGHGPHDGMAVRWHWRRCWWWRLVAVLEVTGRRLKIKSFFKTFGSSLNGIFN